MILSRDIVPLNICLVKFEIFNIYKVFYRNKKNGIYESGKYYLLSRNSTHLNQIGFGKLLCPPFILYLQNFQTGLTMQPAWIS